jgi:hypothetical protein
MGAHLAGVQGRSFWDQEPVTAGAGERGRIREPQYIPPEPERPESELSRRLRWDLAGLIEHLLAH